MDVPGDREERGISERESMSKSSRNSSPRDEPEASHDDQAASQLDTLQGALRPWGTGRVSGRLWIICGLFCGLFWIIWAEGIDLCTGLERRCSEPPHAPSRSVGREGWNEGGIETPRGNGPGEAEGRLIRRTGRWLTVVSCPVANFSVFWISLDLIAYLVRTRLYALHYHL